MTFLPIVERELRVASRRRATYFSRLGSAVGAILIGGWMMLAMHKEAPQSLGQSLFYTMAVLTMISAISGLRVTADCLSEEKRDGTLGLLFLTDLKGYDVVFGKLAASSLGAFYAMLALFPILAISLLLGGVTYNEFWRVVLTCANLLFLSLSLGMLTSAICRDERKALTLAVLIMLLLLGLFPALGVLVALKFNQYPEGILLSSPAYAAVLSFDVWFKPKEDDFWVCTIITHLYSWLFLAMACRIVPRSWQDKASSASREKIETNWTKITQGDSEKRHEYRRGLLEINPYLWLSARDRLKFKAVWIFILAVAGFWIWGLVEFKKDWLNAGTYVVTALILHAVLKVWLATEACRRFVEDRRASALELMLSTPLSVNEILRGQRLALFRQFGPPAIVVLGADLFLMLAGLGEMRHDKDMWVMVWGVGVGIFFFDLWALSWVGMWMGLSTPKVNKASGGAISRILAVPWIVFCLLLTGFLVLTSIFGLRSWMRNIDLPPTIVPVLWFTISGINNLFWVAQARRNLNSRFREVATQRFAATRSLWAKIFGLKEDTSAGE